MFAVVSAASAQDASPARQCADAATGTEVEVCLRLAAEHPDAVDEITAALVAWVDRVEGPDRALLEALLLLQTGAGVEGALRLAATGDLRAEAVLVNVVTGSRDEKVRAAAVAALAAFPGARPELARWIEDARLPAPVRVAAVDALSDPADPETRDSLLELARRPKLGPSVQAAVRRALARDWPSAAPEDLPPSEDGALWVAAGSSFSLGYALGTAGWFGRTRRFEIGAITGASAGATVGWIYGRAWPKDAGDAGLVATSGALGTASGLLIGRSLGDADTAVLAGLGGDGAGLLVSALLAGPHHGTGGDAGEGTAIAVVAGAAGAVGAVASGATPERTALVAGLSLAGGSVIGHAASPSFSLRKDLGAVGVGAAIGGAVGGFASVRPLPAAMSGVGVGAVAGAVVGAWADPPPDLLVGALLGAGTGGALGAGGALVAGASPGMRAAVAGVGGAVGLTAGTTYALVDPDPVDDRDAVLTGVAGAWAGWNAGAVSWILRAPPDRAAGVVLLATSGVGVLTTAANVPLDVPVPQTLCAASLGIWGGYVGWQAGDLANVRDPIAVALPASDAGLVLGGILVSPAVGVPPMVVGVADAGGVFGGAAGALVAGLATDDGDAVTAASLVGAGVGGAAGLVVGAVWHRSVGRRDVVFDVPDLPPVALGPGPGGLGLSVTVGPW